MFLSVPYVTRNLFSHPDVRIGIFTPAKLEPNFSQSFFHLRSDNFSFLVADTPLYKRLCSSIRRVGLLLRRSVGLSGVIQLRSGKSSVLDTFFLYVWVLQLVWGVGGSWMPLPTCPQRYCDPASFVIETIGEILRMLIFSPRFPEIVFWMQILIEIASMKPAGV